MPRTGGLQYVEGSGPAGVPDPITALGYRATRTDDELTIHRVPIFVTCSRGEMEFDEKWLKAAVKKALQAEGEGYLPPLHIRHHEPSTEANNAVRAAGFFRILGTERITFKGDRKLAVMADLIITDSQAADEVLKKRYPYRSVEIFNKDVPSIDGLALLDHEAPFLELPMLMVREVDDQSRRYAMRLETVPAGPVAALFRHGSHASLLMRAEDMTETTTEEAAKTAPEPKQAVLFAEDGKPPMPPGKEEGAEPEGDGEEGEEDGGTKLTVEEICAAISSGAISVADQNAIAACIQEALAAAPQAQAPAAPQQGVAPGAAPAAAPVPMKKAMTDSDLAAQFAALKGENEGLKARLDERDAADRRRDDVSAAMKRLEGRPLGADLEDRLVAFHKDHGPKAFGAYVESMATAIGVLPPSDKGRDLTTERNASPVVMKYQEHGSAAVDRALGFRSEWQQLRERGATSLSEERYLEINMGRVLTPEDN